MGNLFERRGQELDTSQPGIRQIQAWIRSRALLSIQLLDGTKLEGVVRWVDCDYLALQPEQDSEPVLLNRHAVALLRALA
jgi:host factor-I protein